MWAIDGEGWISGGVAMFPRQWCALVVGGGGVRHLQNRRGEGRGKTIWPKNCSKAALIE
jgi:hypothetical protein